MKYAMPRGMSVLLTPQVRGGAKRRTLNLLVRLLIPTSQTNAKNVATVAVR